MSGLCGWLGRLGGDEPPDRVLGRMASGLRIAAGSKLCLEARPGGGLALVSSAPEADLHADERFVVALQGYPYWSSDDLAACARELGHGRALTEAYRAHGSGLLERLHGAFSLALIDHREGKAFIAVDRMGVEPMCYTRAGDGTLVFGSTAGSMRACPGVRATVSPQQVFNYFHFYRVPAPGTIFEEQYKLLPAQCLLCDGTDAEPEFYWQMPYQEHGDAPFGVLVHELLGALRAAVERAIAGEDPTRIGAFLSGGLDSSTVAGFLGDVGRAPAKTFTIGFDVKGFDESHYAEVAARHFGTQHRTYRVTAKDVFDFVPRIAEVYDEPFGNASAVPTYYCARLAREHGVDLMLAGDGGDELFAGNERYVDQLVFDVYLRVPGPLRRGIIEPILLNVPGGDSVTLLRKARSYIRRADIPMPQRTESYNYYASVDLAEVLDPAFLDSVDREEPVRLMCEVYERTRSRSMLQRMLHLDLQMTLADNDLRKVSQMSELSSVRVRFPFLDEGVVAAAARVPPEMLVKGFKLRHFYKEALKDYLPHEVLGKRKHGFGLPEAYWLLEYKPLRELALGCLERFKERGYVRPAFIDRLVHLHRTDHTTYYGGLVWDLMILDLWLYVNDEPRVI